MADRAGVPLLDDDQIDLLREALGEEDLRAMYADFPKSVQDSFRAIGAAVEAGDLLQVRRAAHVLKGVAGSFGAGRLSWLASQIELELTSVALVSDVMPLLIETIEQTAASLTAMTSGHSQTVDA